MDVEAGAAARDCSWRGGGVRQPARQLSHSEPPVSEESVRVSSCKMRSPHDSRLHFCIMNFHFELTLLPSIPAM